MRQRDRVLRALKRHPDGVTQVDFLAPNVIDGGAPITRVAARIRDLRQDGHVIEVNGERYGCVVYRLPQPEPVPIPPPEMPEIEPAEQRLFDPPTVSAIFGDAA